jgi:hypothetical protein
MTKDFTTTDQTKEPNPPWIRMIYLSFPQAFMLTRRKEEKMKSIVSRLMEKVI